MPYKIMVKERGSKWEEVDEADTRPEAEQLTAQYASEYGGGWEVKFTQNSKGKDKGLDSRNGVM